MNKKIKFVTLYPRVSNISLVKDVGQIPYSLSKYYGYDCALASSYIDNNGDYVDIVKTQLNIHHVRQYSKNYRINGLIYLLKWAKKIDVLNLYSYDRHIYVWIKLYKMLNKRGIVYVKLDLDYQACDQLDVDLKRRKLFYNVTKTADIISSETIPVRNRLQEHSAKEILYIKNGVFFERKKNKVQEKKNVFLTVARLGTEQKATDILLEAFAKTANKHNWTLKLVGSVANEFKKYIEDFFAANPNMKERVLFLGEINDRDKLKALYSEAKVFVLASRWESSAIVLPEALFNGCYIITSSCVPTAEVVTHDGLYGTIVQNVEADELSEALLNATLMELNNTLVEAIQTYALKEFDWEKICSDLYTKIQLCMCSLGKSVKNNRKHYYKKEV